MVELVQGKKYNNKWIVVGQMLFAFVLLIFSIDLLTVSLLHMNNEVANKIFMATNNPFVGLFIGLLMTALIQSSSTVTAMVVAVVASGSLSIMQAVPLVMGANIGTTITSTLVSFTYIMKKSEYKKALSAGVLHDLFNIITVVILLPLEFYFGLLSEMAHFITVTFFDGVASLKSNFYYQIGFTRPLTNLLVEWVNFPFLSLLLSVLLIFLSIKLLSGTVYKAFVSSSFKKVSKHIFRLPYRSFAYGFFITAAVQSSTVTTSLIVPAVATKKIPLNKVFPFIIGANIGTTVTAGIAAIFKTEAAITIAIVHFLFNIIGALIFLPFPAIRNIPVKLATYFSKKSAKLKFVGFAYILLTFFIIPFLLIYFNKNDDVRDLDVPWDQVNATEIQKDVP